MKQLTSILKQVHSKAASIALLMVAISIQSVAQTFWIPDVNFRTKLMNNYSSVMTGNQLNIAAAQSYTFDVILAGSNISDLTGIEYFTSTFKIDVSYNNLTSIPALSNTSPLKYLYANNNQLTQLPNISGLTGLLELQVSFNKLTSLPPLNTLYSLTHLLASDNNLTLLPPINNLTQLKFLIIGNNPFTSLPDFSPNFNLLELHVHQSGISQIQGLASLTKLKKLYCWQNSITDLSALSANITLNGLYANQNKLSALPTLTNKPNLTAIEIGNNQLTFEDLLPLTSLNLFDFAYSPQDSIGVYTQVPTRLSHPLTLGITEDANVTSSTYTWHKNGAGAGTTSVNQKTITSSAQATDAGVYYVSITNPNLPSLILTRRMWNVSIINCMDLVSYTFTIAANECSSGATINSSVVLAGGTAPYQYSLTPVGSTNVIHSSTGDFAQIAPGQYTYAVTDANGCSMDTAAIVQKPAKCDPVITPNGDPQMSSYFIEQAGTAKIIDIEGKTIMQLTTPAVWYGTKTDGSFADAGYYVIIVNNKKVTNITVIR